MTARAQAQTQAQTRVAGTIVVGLGGIGSAAAYHLAARGEPVLGLDPRPPGHREGSSHGGTRLVRRAYFESPEYVPLATAAWEGWRELERASGERLLTASGVLALGRRGDPLRLVPDTVAAGRMHGLGIERLTAAEIRARFPAVRVDDDWEGAFEREAGFVDPEATVRAHHRLAQDAGAEFRAERVVSIAFGEHPLVTTDAAVYRPDRVIVAAGPWAPELLAPAGIVVAARRKTVAHFAPAERPADVVVPPALTPSALTPPTLPGFAISTGDHLYYGFPHLPGQGVKIGRHDGGEPCTPATVDRIVRAGEVDELHAVLERFLPAAAGPELTSYTCLYTMSADEHFILGALPGSPTCFVATGCSGHAFKFVPVLGRILADLATGVTPPFDLGFLSPSRPAAGHGAVPDRRRA